VKSHEEVTWQLSDQPVIKIGRENRQSVFRNLLDISSKKLDEIAELVGSIETKPAQTDITEEGKVHKLVHKLRLLI